MTREFKIDITLAAEIAQFLEGILEADFNEEFDSEETCTDTFLDQFMPNGFISNTELAEALKRSGIITRIAEPEAYDLIPIPGSPGEFKAVKIV